MSPPAASRLAFDDVVIDFAGQRLLRDGAVQALEPKAFAVLALLAGSPGQVFTREQILDRIWGHRHVTQSVLNRIMSLLRQALGEDATHPRLLRTIYGVGYRFDLPATEVTAPDPDIAADTGAAEYSDPRAVTALPDTGPRWRWLAALAAILLLAVAGLFTRQPGADSIASHSSNVPAAVPSLAVLPFADLSRRRDQGYLADGLAEEILNQLAQAPGLRVVGRASSFSFRDRHEDVPGIGRKLGVAYLLKGSVRRDGGHLRVAAQLVRADDGSQLWSQIYARELRDVFAVQEEISRQVAQALSVKLDVARFNRQQGGSTNVEAYERFLRWRGIGMRELFDFQHDRERLQLAREMVALDPHCVLCRDALAVSLNALANELGDPQAASLRSEALQVRADIATLSPDSWIAKRDRANALWRAGKRAEAITLAKQVVDGGPPSKERIWDYAYMIYAVGHLQDTISLVEQARAVEPMALFLSRDLQYDYTAARRYQDAEAEYQRGRQLEGSQAEPDYLAFFRQLASQRPGGVAELRQLHRRLIKQNQALDTPFFRELGNLLDRPEAMLARVRHELEQPIADADAYSVYVAFNVADALGDTELAVVGLRRYLQAQDGFESGGMAQYPYVAFWNAPYSGLRAHPDFKRLLRQAGVVDYWRQSGRWGDGCAPVGVDDFQCR
ncbi:winged helix-turn-helix domain-containing protein [Pseudoxanthomonas dokdonensis]|uniref:winged helix-turn-helix domain-containing protein n=1 Tax=Pseudoxanthomonas dokdonensis TaxID=344882 RepID=UPI000B0BBBF4|nr:winged helix-turn-helix domain-containing protein [Pseudoxanthomonas dokdonensis]